MTGRGPAWVIVRELDEPDAVLAVARDHEVTLGFASAGPTRDADAPTAWELYAIDVVASALGSGLAQDLLATVVADRPVTAWTLCDNARALAFYLKEGFVVDAARRLHEGSGRAEMRLLRGGARR